jgi:hypothetical protein
LAHRTDHLRVLILPWGAVLAVLAVLATGCPPDRPADTVKPTSSSTAVAATPPAIGSTGPALVSVDSLVVANRRGEIIEVSAADGSVRRLLAGPEETGGSPGHLSVDKNGRAVFFDRGPPGCWSEFSYLLGGPGVSGEGSWPAAGPDGRRLAVVTGADPCKPDRVAIHDIDTPEVREWSLDPALKVSGLFVQGPLSWSSDGARVAVPLKGPSGARVTILELEKSMTIRSDPLSSRQPEGRVVAAFFVASGPAELVLALEACCGSHPTSWTLDRRTFSGRLGGSVPRSLTIPEPMSLHATLRGEVTVVTREGRLLTGSGLNLRKLPGGGYVAGARR